MPHNMFISDSVSSSSHLGLSMFFYCESAARQLALGYYFDLRAGATCFYSKTMPGAQE